MVGLKGTGALIETGKYNPEMYKQNRFFTYILKFHWQHQKIKL